MRTTPHETHLAYPRQQPQRPESAYYREALASVTMGSYPSSATHHHFGQIAKLLWASVSSSIERT